MNYLFLKTFERNLFKLIYQPKIIRFLTSFSIVDIGLFFLNYLGS
jgi:hypothetical protein